MVLPQFSDTPPGLMRSPKPDWRAVTVSLPEAISFLEQKIGQSVDIRKAELIHVWGQVYYKVNIQQGGLYLIDGMNGDVRIFDAKMAEDLLQQHFSSPVAIKNMERLDRYDLAYLWGPLPAMRFTLDDPGGTLVYMSLQNGSIRWSSDLTSIRAVIESFHTFDTIKLISHRKEIPRIGLLFFGLIGIGVVLTGAVLALKPLRK